MSTDDVVVHWIAGEEELAESKQTQLRPTLMEAGGEGGMVVDLGGENYLAGELFGFG
jgi:hypothetical protein